MSMQPVQSLRLAQATTLPATNPLPLGQLADLVNVALGARTLTVLAGGLVAVGATGVVWNLQQLQQFHAGLERGDYSASDLRAFSQRIERSGGGFGGIIMRMAHPELDALLRPPRQPKAPSVDDLRTQLFRGFAPMREAPAAMPQSPGKPVDIALRASQASMARFAEPLGSYRDRLSEVRSRGMQLIESGRDTTTSTASVNRAVAALDKLIDRVERLAALDGMRAVFAAMPNLRRLTDASTSTVFSAASLDSRTAKVQAEVRSSAKRFAVDLHTAERDVSGAERRDTAPQAGDSTMAVAKGPGELIDPQRGKEFGPNAGVGSGRDVTLPPSHTALPRVQTDERKKSAEFPADNARDPLGDRPRHTGTSRQQSSPFRDTGTPQTTALGNGSLMRSEQFPETAAEWREPAVAEARWLREGSDATLPHEIENHIQSRYGVSPAEARQVVKQAVHESNHDMAEMRGLIRNLARNHSLTEPEMAQMQALNARLSPNDARWVEPLIAVLVRGVATGSIGTPRELTVSVTLSLMLAERGYDFNAAADGSPRIVRRPPSTIAAMDPYLTDLSKRAGYQNNRVLVAVVEGEFDVKHTSLVLRTNRDPDNTQVRPGAEPWTDHSAAVSSVITSRNLLTRIAPVSIAPVPIDQTAALIERAISDGARVVNISARPRSDKEADDWRAVALRHRDVLFTVAAGNDLATEGSRNERMNRLRGSANVLIVANARNGEGLFLDSQGGVGYSTHVAIGTNVPVAYGTSAGTRSAGTSISAPVVARVAAQMFAADPRLDGAQALEILDLTVLQSPGLANAANSGGLTNERAAVTLAALTGLRRQGVPLDVSLKQLRLTGDTAAWFAQAALQIVPYLPSIDSTRVTLRAMEVRYGLGPSELALLERIVVTRRQPAPNQIGDAANDIGLARDGPQVATLLERLGLQNSPGVADTVRAMFDRERVRAAASRNLPATPSSAAPQH